MGQTLFFSVAVPLRYARFPVIPKQRLVHNARFPHKTASSIQAKEVLSEFPNERKYPRVGADSTGSIPAAELLGVVELAAKTGAEVVMAAVNKPRNISYKGVTDLVTDTDKLSESAILNVVRKNFKDHLILGEEGGLIGDTRSDYLWCIDPLDGTTNFAHCYPSFGVSVGVLFRGRPAAASVVEFVGGPMCWNTRTFSASSCGGAFCNGQKINVSQTDQIVEEAGGTVSCMNGGKFSVFDRSVLVSNGIVHDKLLETIGPATEDLKKKGIDFSLWFKPESYVTDI